MLYFRQMKIYNDIKYSYWFKKMKINILFLVYFLKNNFWKLLCVIYKLKFL